MNRPTLPPSHVEKFNVAMVSFAIAAPCAMIVVGLLKLELTDKVVGWWHLPWLTVLIFCGFNAIHLFRYGLWALTAPEWEYEFETGYNRRQENLQFHYAMQDFMERRNPPKSDDYKAGFDDYMSRNKAMAKPTNSDYCEGWQAAKDSSQ